MSPNHPHLIAVAKVERAAASSHVSEYRLAATQVQRALIYAIRHTPHTLTTYLDFYALIRSMRSKRRP